MKNSIVLMICLLAGGFAARAQTFTDVTFGASKQDRAFLNLAVRKQFSDKFRAGVEVQTGVVNYRFIGAKVIDKGNSTSISIPSSIRLYQHDKIRLDFYSRVGVRFLNVGEHYSDERSVQSNSSVGFNIEPGLAVSLLLSNKFNIQSGFTLPNVFELTPEFIYENNVSNLFVNAGYKISEKSTIILKTNFGPAAGADGDSQKFIYSFQAGLRFALGKDAGNHALRIDPTF